MSPKIRMFFAVLAITAGLVLYQTYDSFHGSSLSSNILSSAGKNLPPPDEDTDHDGLTNVEESLWNTDYQNPDTDGDGFLDGEEVASGHDPTIPGPDDLLPQYQKNVTEKTGNLVFSGLFEGSLRQNSPNFNTSVNQIVDEIVYQSQINIGLTSSNHFVVVPNTPENERIYDIKILALIQDIVSNDPLGLRALLEAYKNVGDPTKVDDPILANVFTTQNLLLQKQIDQLAQMQVPQRWSVAHDNLLTLLKKILNAYASIQNVQKDPLQSFVAISDLIDFLIKDLENAVKPFIELKS